VETTFPCNPKRRVSFKANSAILHLVTLQYRCNSRRRGRRAVPYVAILSFHATFSTPHDTVKVLMPLLRHANCYNILNQSCCFSGGGGRNPSLFWWRSRHELCGTVPICSRVLISFGDNHISLLHLHMGFGHQQCISINFFYRLSSKHLLYMWKDISL
jgi:hypothetical protein